jgi:hypothetical protein
MATTKSRINITLSDDAKKAIAKLAKRDEVPDATLAARLIETALELEEDIVWDTLATKRDVQDVPFISHDKAWQ